MSRWWAPPRSSLLLVSHSQRAPRRGRHDFSRRLRPGALRLLQGALLLGCHLRRNRTELVEEKLGGVKVLSAESDDPVHENKTCGGRGRRRLAMSACSASNHRVPSTDKFHYLQRETNNSGCTGREFHSIIFASMQRFIESHRHPSDSCTRCCPTGCRAERVSEMGVFRIICGDWLNRSHHARPRAAATTGSSQQQGGMAPFF